MDADGVSPSTKFQELYLSSLSRTKRLISKAAVKTDSENFKRTASYSENDTAPP